MNHIVPVASRASAWPFRLLIIAWLAGGVAIAWFQPALGVPATIVMGLLWLGGLGVLLRDFIASFLGPVLSYDLLRMGRKKRTFWSRSLYAGMMGVMFTWLFLSWSLNDDPYQPRNNPSALARLAETFFAIYMIVQFILVCLVTPGAMATTITDEKERRTIEFMLATDLRDREILFGKFASRVGGILMLLFAGLPVLTMMQFFGGINPEEVIAGFAATFVIVLSISAVSLAASVLSRKNRDAIALTYLLMAAYASLSLVAMFVAIGITRSGAAAQYGLDFVNWEDVVYPFVTGNPFYMVPDLTMRGGSSSSQLLTGATHFVAFHLTCFALFALWSAWRLRSIALAQTFGGSGKRRLFRKSKDDSKQSSPASGPLWTRPEIGDSPILWKEVFVDSGLRMGLFARVVITLLVILSFAPVGIIVADNLFFEFGPSRSFWDEVRWKDLGSRMNAYVRVLSPMVASMVFLGIAIRGAGAIVGERDRHSLDVLLTTPLNAMRILWGKWWGCLLGMRMAWAWLGSIWLIGLAAGGLHLLMLPPLIISTAIYAGGFAWIGVFCSVSFSTSLRATVMAIVMSLFAGGGFFLLFLCFCVLPIELSGARAGNGSDMDVLIDFLCGFSPPVNLAWLPIHDFEDEYRNRMSSRDFPYVICFLTGLAGWGMVNALLARVSADRFRRMANRLPISNKAPRPSRRED